MQELTQLVTGQAESGAQIWFAPGVTPDMQTRIAAVLPDPSQQQAPAGAVILKQARQRLVCDIEVPGLPGDRAVAKMFPLRRLTSRLRHRKYARAEFLNTLAAAELGIPTPRAYAFFEKRRNGLVTGSGLLIERLDRLTTLADVAETQGYLAAAHRASPALLELYDAGVLHADARDENIFIEPGGDGYCLIDWQYARIHSPRCAWLLEYLAGYFLRYVPETERDRLQQGWLPALFEQAGMPDTYEAFAARVAAIVAKRPGTRARLRLAPVRLPQEVKA